MKCNQCNKNLGKKFIRLYYFDKKFSFCSKDCYEKNFWKKYNEKSNEKSRAYFRKEYYWVVKDVKKIISKEDAIKLYNSEIKGGFEILFEKMQKEYPELYKYKCEKELTLLMLNVALEAIGEIED